MPNNPTKKKHVLVVSDNESLIQFFAELLEEMSKAVAGTTFVFACAPWNKALSGKKVGAYTVGAVDVKKDFEAILSTYDLVISAHCKQLFPAPLTNGVTCINIHPGLNPYNRGWYPQVFSIINGLPLGATIHEIDEEIDHGAIIDQQKVEINSYDTSLDAYERVQEAEKKLLERSLESILKGNYTKTKMSDEGNLNLKKDFEALREINLDEKTTYGQAIDKFRALTHGSFKNAYFYDDKTGKRIFVSINLEPEDE